MTTALITGANRGIGFEFLRQLSNLVNGPKTIIATTRNPGKSEELNKYAASCQNAKIVVAKLEMTDEADRKAIVDVVKQNCPNGLNLLINNAGILDRNALNLDQISAENLHNSFDVNCVSPLLLTRELFPLIKQAADALSDLPVSLNRACIIMMTTRMASIEDATSGKYYSYRLSKVALNMASHNLALEYGPQGVLVALMHPGMVKTDMTNHNGIEPSESVKSMLSVVANMKPENAGKMYHFQGEVLPW